MLGQDPWSRRERTDRFAEFVDFTDRLLRAPETSFSGRFYAADGARTYPGCVQQPRVPFAIAATGPRGMQLAATFADTWVTTGDRWTDDLLEPEQGAAFVRAQMARLDDACAAIGRDPAPVSRLVLSGISLDPGSRRRPRSRRRSAPTPAQA